VREGILGVYNTDKIFLLHYIGYNLFNLFQIYIIEVYNLNDTPKTLEVQVKKLHLALRDQTFHTSGVEHSESLGYIEFRMMSKNPVI
jgi:hypothetical protein